jgi:hypothetical protein
MAARTKNTRARRAQSPAISPPNPAQALTDLIAAARLAVADFNVLAAGFDALGHHTSAGMARKQAGVLLAALEKAPGHPEPIAPDAPLQVGERVRIISRFYAGVGRLKGRHTGTVESVTGWREDLIQIRMDDPDRGNDGFCYPRARECERLPPVAQRRVPHMVLRDGEPICTHSSQPDANECRDDHIAKGDGHEYAVIPASEVRS